MIEGPAVSKAMIRRHYDWCTPFYRLLWGEHIHHGLWCGDEGPVVAQSQLVRLLIERMGLVPESRVLDVGCGIGGTSLHLAREHRCRVVGITLSPVQCAWARLRAILRRVSDRASFLVRDAERVTFPEAAFDHIVSIECTEHLHDKGAFFRRAARWLVPGGRIGICAWLAGSDLDESGRSMVETVCEAFLCPSLGTAADYRDWLEAAGLRVTSVDLLSNRVVRTWEIVERRTASRALRALAGIVGEDMLRFLEHFRTIRRALEYGAMNYGVFVATRM